MATHFWGEGNIGSKPEYKEFANGNKEPRRLVRLNVYFDNSIPRDNGEYEDRGGFWANVELWHKDAERYSRLYAKGVRVLVQGKMVMDRWEGDDGVENCAMKVQATRIGILPHRVDALVMSAPDHAATEPEN
ncbi:single-stranded DNA-binding protein [Pseudomonas cichorii]|uniref:single-stranded DNA-binding protein n=1 Tax=Pseudomonas capsici TaxID=2810614 RepID=UPI000E3E0AD3|nr:MULTISPECIES: single-stranded DNA-binding protein [Pseudomonas]MBX8508920.1 single-stranded DNA-binding protein [Pseudomonas cichorii]MBX8524483.1 single-stranded DNA-binding protein [Pseudomonas cichorii]MCV4286478.1 single-stranded DNA-binding protein [Pseudomonas capsici]